MKKFIMMLVCTFAMHTMVMADNDKPIQVSQLPAKAQTLSRPISRITRWQWLSWSREYSIKAMM